MNQVLQRSDWFGYQKIDYEFQGREALLVEPHHAAPGRPWIWRTEFFGHEPQFDLALLQAGWHVAYLKVSDMYGSPAAVREMRAFQAHLETEYGLSAKSVLEGMSRGGLYAFNYAATSPEKVAALYLDNPVLDIRSWPGGMGAAPGDAVCWSQCLERYGVGEADLATFVGNPLDQIDPVAQANIPLLMVCGDADEAVPFEENAAILAARYRELGAPLNLIVKPGAKHHPHSLVDPEPLVAYLRQQLPSAFAAELSQSETS